MPHTWRENWDAWVRKFGSAREPRFDVLFEPVKIGPISAKNRFFQVPHCNGMGYRDISALAMMRQVKAEGGWAVVCTEEVEIHPTSDVTPYVEGRLWDDRDIPAHARVAEAIHDGGALAGIELAHSGLAVANLGTREVPMGPSDLPVLSAHPVQARSMSKADIATLRAWHRAAVRRSLQAGYDLVYVYAGHNLGVAQHFLSPRYNHRTDEYGGSLRNRMRLLRELIEDTAEECEGRAAVAVRLCVDEMVGSLGFTRDDIDEVVAEIAELPDLWDFMVGDWSNDSSPSRFAIEGSHSEHLRGLKQLTTKPVVGVGRFTGPDLMVDQIRSGTMDSLGRRDPRLRTRFFPTRSNRASSTTSGNASVAMYACPAITRCHQFAARRTPPWVKSGAGAGIPNTRHLRNSRNRCWWSAPARQAWKLPGRSGIETAASHCWRLGENSAAG